LLSTDTTTAIHKAHSHSRDRIVVVSCSYYTKPSILELLFHLPPRFFFESEVVETPRKVVTGNLPEVRAFVFSERHHPSGGLADGSDAVDVIRDALRRFGRRKRNTLYLPRRNVSILLSHDGSEKFVDV
jgi:hypothetical protein